MPEVPSHRVPSQYPEAISLGTVGFPLKRSSLGEPILSVGASALTLVREVLGSPCRTSWLLSSQPSWSLPSWVSESSLQVFYNWKNCLKLLDNNSPLSPSCPEAFCWAGWALHLCMSMLPGFLPVKKHLPLKQDWKHSNEDWIWTSTELSVICLGQLRCSFFTGVTGFFSLVCKQAIAC